MCSVLGFLLFCLTFNIFVLRTQNGPQMIIFDVLIAIILMLITNITILLPLIIFPTADYLDWGVRTGGTGERQASKALVQGLTVAVAVKDHNLFHHHYHH